MNFLTNGAIRKSTPQVVKNIRDTLLYAISGSLVFTSFLAPFFNTTPLHFAEGLGFSMFGVKVIAKCFGVSEEETMQNAKDAKAEVKKLSDDK